MRNVPAPSAVLSAAAIPARSVRAIASAVFVALLLACTPAAEPTPAESGVDPVLQSRDVLGEPMVELAETGISLSQALDTARHEVARGAGMLRALREVESKADDAREAAQAAAEAAATATVADAAAIVADAAAQVEGATDAAEREVRFLGKLQAVDAGLLEAAGEWDRPGSQSEIRARLAGVAADVAAVARQARRLKPIPARCNQMKRNRTEWASTVRQRTQRLQEQANSAGGSTFDELRDAYRRLPFGVEPRSADQDGQPCWRQRSLVPQTAEDLRTAVGALEESLRKPGS